MNAEEKKLDNLMNELGEVLAKVRGNLHGILIIDTYRIDISRTEYIELNGQKVHNTKLILRDTNKE